MPYRARPTWDVPGLMLAHFDGRTERTPWHIRTYRDGHGYVRMGDLWVPISPTLTAIEYLESGFERIFGAPMRKTGSGD